MRALISCLNSGKWLRAIVIVASLLSLALLSPTSDSPSQAQSNLRIYGPGSPFNTPIPANATYTPENRIGAFRQTMEEWSMPIYRIPQGTSYPLVTIENLYSSRTERWPIPTFAQPAPADDHHLGVIDRNTNSIYEMWNAAWVGTTRIRAGGMKDFGLDGTGVSNPPNQRVTAAGFAVSAGMVIREDFTNPSTGQLTLNTTIDHALAMSLNRAIINTSYVAPAVGGETSGQGGASGIPMGALFAIPKSVNVDALNVHPLSRELLRAARDYGIYVNDGNGAPAYQGKYVGNIRIEPGLVQELTGTHGDNMISRVQQDIFGVIQQHGIYRVTAGQTTPSNATVSGRTWIDANQNGLRDSNEAALGGVQVTLHRSNGQVVSSVNASPSGTYQFSVAPGDYFLRFSAPANHIFTLRGVGSNRQIDSDVGPDGQTAVFSLTSGQNSANWDAGYIRATVSITPTTMTVYEGGNSNHYFAYLNNPPTANVTLRIQPGPQLTSSVSQLVFTSANWNTPQQVVITARDDNADEGTHTDQVGHTVQSSDPFYNGVSVPNVVVTIIDNDRQNNPPRILSGQPSVTVNEGVRATNSGSLYDPDGDTLQVSASIGTISNQNNTAWSWYLDTTDGPAQSQTVTLTVRDPDGASQSINFALTVNNVAPQATFSVDVAAQNEPYTLRFSNITDPSPADISAGMRYSYDCTNDGTFEVTDITAPTYTCPFPGEGNFTARGRVRDKDGGANTYTAPVTFRTTPRQVSTNLQQFVLLGLEGIWVQSDTAFNSGSIGVLSQSNRYLTGSHEIQLDTGVHFGNATSQIYSNGVRLQSQTVVYDVFYNTLQNNGNILGQSAQGLSLPLPLVLPSPLASNPNNSDYTVSSGQQRTLNAGRYRLLRVNSGATLVFRGGVYHFDSWDIRDDVRLRFDAPTQIFIRGRISTGLRVDIHPLVNRGLTAADMVIYVEGSNSRSNPDSGTRAAYFGRDARILANIYAPNGTIHIDHRAKLTGSFIGRWIRVGSNSEITLLSAFNSLGFNNPGPTRPIDPSPDDEAEPIPFHDLQPLDNSTPNPGDFQELQPLELTPLDGQ